MSVCTIRENSYEDFESTLTRLNVDGRSRNMYLRHERAHFEKAKELGYTPQYVAKLIVDNPSIIILAAVDFIGREPTPSDMVKICLAPRRPSKEDLELAVKNGWKRSKR
ncbi:MAG: hypothetical protein AABX35_01845 [Nanoarchaeota archaeon]